MTQPINDELSRVQRELVRLFDRLEQIEARLQHMQNMLADGRAGASFSLDAAAAQGQSPVAQPTQGQWQNALARFLTGGQGGEQ